MIDLGIQLLFRKGCVKRLHHYEVEFHMQGMTAEESQMRPYFYAILVVWENKQVKKYYVFNMRYGDDIHIPYADLKADFEMRYKDTFPIKDQRHINEIVAKGERPVWKEITEQEDQQLYDLMLKTQHAPPPRAVRPPTARVFHKNRKGYWVT